MNNSILLYSIVIMPIIAVLICSYLFSKKLNIWERILIFVIPTIIIIAIKYISTYNQTKDTEFWNSYITRATYYEYWETWIEQTCQRCVQTDTNGNCTQYESYDCSYCNQHPEYYEVYDNIGNIVRISESKFLELSKLWNNKQYQDMHRNINFDECGKDGDAYTTLYDGLFEHTAPLCKSYTYENKIQCSQSLFNFPEIDSMTKSTYKLFDYPSSSNIFYYNPILGDNNISASTELSFYNAHMGYSKKVHMLILVFNNLPIEAAFMQEAYWKKGNKNEFILCIGKKDTSITWTKVISWTDVQDLKVKVERKTKEIGYNLPMIIDSMAYYVTKDFIKKDFKDFNYLTVEPSTKSIIIAFIITVVITIGLCIWFIFNKFDLED